MIKKYKLILNIGYDDETIITFDRLTRQKVSLLNTANNYIILCYSEFLDRYLWFDANANDYEKNIFNNNLEYYTNEEVL